MRVSDGEWLASVFRGIIDDIGSEYIELDSLLRPNRIPSLLAYFAWKRGANERHNRLIHGKMPIANLFPSAILRV